MKLGLNLERIEKNLRWNEDRMGPEGLFHPGFLSNFSVFSEWLSIKSIKKPLSDQLEKAVARTAEILFPALTLPYLNKEFLLDLKYKSLYM